MTRCTWLVNAVREPFQKGVLTVTRGGPPGGITTGMETFHPLLYLLAEALMHTSTVDFQTMYSVTTLARTLGL